MQQFCKVIDQQLIKASKKKQGLLYIHVFMKVHRSIHVVLFTWRLFDWGFSSNSRIFCSYGNVTIGGEGLQILNCARKSWSLKTEGDLACHKYCDMWHPFIIFISEDPRHLHLLLSVQRWICNYLFLRLCRCLVIYKHLCYIFSLTISTQYCFSFVL